MTPLLLFTSVINAAASELVLKNGDRVSGKIVSQNDDTVVVETVYAGKVTIARTYIERIDGEASVAKASVESKPVSAGGPSETSSAAGSSSATTAETPAMKFSVGSSNRFSARLSKFASEWDGNANIGFSYTSGNANNITMTTGLRAVRANPNGGVSVYFRSLWNSTHGSIASTTTQNAYWGGGRYDRNISKKYFSFVSYDFERDKPRKLNFRSVVGGGIGHRTIKSENTELELLTGIAWNRTWQTGFDTNTPEGLAGIVLKHKINSRLKFQNNFNFFQNVTDISEYRILFDTMISVDVTRRVGVYFSIGDRFNNDPLGHAKKNDFLLTTGLKWNFGKKK